MFRIGHGYDVHKFGGDKPLILGGVLFEGEQGLLAHSDGDVVLHAVCDALLGAIAKGDIGHHFPDTSDEFAGADSKELLKSVMALVTKEGYQLGNLDVTIVAQAPKMANKIDKETQEHKRFYENFLKFTTYSTIIVIVIVALMAIFLV